MMHFYFLFFRMIPFFYLCVASLYFQFHVCYDIPLTKYKNLGK